MRLSRLQIRNFRNLPDIDIPLARDVIVVGENRSGKSNLVTAVRLVLDQTLSAADRRLPREDFWDGLGDGAADYDPLSAGEVIEIAIDLTEFDDNVYLVALLGDGLVATAPLTARLTFRWGPADEGSDDYRAGVYLGDSVDRRVPPDLRDRLYLAYLHALRDVESDIRSWRRSPLRALLEAAAADTPAEALAELAEAVSAAQDGVDALPAIAALSRAIGDRTEQIVGVRQALETELAGTPQDPIRMIRALQLYVDGPASRPLSAASLGAQNILYLALLELGMEAKVSDSSIEHAFLAIEEPEAHLHPHLQRSLLRNLISEDSSKSLIVTTHSPHVVSAADPRSLVRLQPSATGTVAFAAHDAELSDEEWADIARYLDATRSEMVFAARALLVEGFSEQVLIPALGRADGVSFDKEGITVCAIHGTHFRSYVRFCEALGIPWAVVTDGDPTAAGHLAGTRRAERLVRALGRADEAPASVGIFVGSSTFEVDLLEAGTNGDIIADALIELADGRTRLAPEVDAWNDQGREVQLYMTLIDRLGGKGRFAQRLSKEDLEMPDYIRSAIEYLMTR